jgi:hypothetical protein
MVLSCLSHQHWTKLTSRPSTTNLWQQYEVKKQKQTIKPSAMLHSEVIARRNAFLSRCLRALNFSLGIDFHISMLTWLHCHLRLKENLQAILTRVK